MFPGNRREGEKGSRKLLPVGSLLYWGRGSHLNVLIKI
jgi:hypothetical protein